MTTAPRVLVVLLFVGVFLAVGGKRWLDGLPIGRGLRWYLVVMTGLLLVQYLFTTY